MAKTRRTYTGASVSTTTLATIGAASTSPFDVKAVTNWPYGSDPFYVVIEPGTASEEKMLVTRTSSGDVTINISARAQDDTSAVEHANGSTIYPVFTAVDADEANELAAMWEAKGDIVSHGASTFARLAVGSDDTVLIADSSAGSGLSWGQVGTANIAADAVTNAKIGANAVDTAELAAGAVTETELDSAVVSKLLPAGTIAATIKSSADTGWLLLDGSTVTGAESTYPALWAVAPLSWQSGSNLVLPDMSDKMLFGQSTTALGASGGANSKTIASANLPTHSHTINHGHAHSITADQGSHSHTISVTVNSNTTKFVYNTESYAATDYIATDTSLAAYYSASDFGMAVANVSSHSHTASGSATSADPTITVSGGVTNHTGSSGDGGFANTALDVTNAHLAVNFQIKAH